MNIDKQLRQNISELNLVICNKPDEVEFILGMKGFYIRKAVSIFYYINRLGEKMVCVKTMYQCMKTDKIHCLFMLLML